MTDLALDLPAVLKLHLGRVELAEYHLEQGARVLPHLLRAEGAQLLLDALGQANPLDASVVVLAHDDLDRFLLVIAVSHHEVAVVLDHDLEVLVLCNPAVD